MAQVAVRSVYEIGGVLLENLPADLLVGLVVRAAGSGPEGLLAVVGY